MAKNADVEKQEKRTKGYNRSVGMDSAASLSMEKPTSATIWKFESKNRKASYGITVLHLASPVRFFVDKEQELVDGLYEFGCNWEAFIEIGTPLPKRYFEVFPIQECIQSRFNYVKSHSSNDSENQDPVTHLFLPLVADILIFELPEYWICRPSIEIRAAPLNAGDPIASLGFPTTDYEYAQTSPHSTPHFEDPFWSRRCLMVGQVLQSGDIYTIRHNNSSGVSGGPLLDSQGNAFAVNTRSFYDNYPSDLDSFQEIHTDSLMYYDVCIPEQEGVRDPNIPTSRNHNIALSLHHPAVVAILAAIPPYTKQSVCRKCKRPASNSCSLCGHPTYCSKGCQIADWTDRHKNECPKLRYAVERN